MAQDPHPSGTVVVLRDRGGLEVLLLERPGKAGVRGPSVFPGGRVEPGDRVGAAGNPREEARVAAVREAAEESGLRLDPAGLLPISRWITPDVSPRRFDTWFFLAAVSPDVAVRVDGEEIHDHRWLPPGHALDAQRRGEIRLAPPTFVTVSWLEAYSSADEAREALGSAPLVTFRPRICRLAGGAVMLYPGDAGYEAADPEREGPRHRVWAGAGDQWRYERS